GQCQPPYQHSATVSIEDQQCNDFQHLLLRQCTSASAFFITAMLPWWMMSCYGWRGGTGWGVDPWGGCTASKTRTTAPYASFCRNKFRMQLTLYIFIIKTNFLVLTAN